MGGHEAAPQRLYRIAGGRREVIGGTDEAGNWHNPLLAGFRFLEGKSFAIETGGGCGWGDPKRRAVEQVVADVIDGYILVAQAARDHGIRVNPATCDAKVVVRK